MYSENSRVVSPPVYKFSAHEFTSLHTIKCLPAFVIQLKSFSIESMMTSSRYDTGELIWPWTVIINLGSGTSQKLS
jgi:hypothetical protein